MRFFLTICVVAVAISFPSAESAGASGNKVSADGKAKVRKNDYIEVIIEDFDENKEYTISVSCGIEDGEEKICGEVQANGFAETGDFDLEVGSCKSVNPYNEKYCKVDIQMNRFTFKLKGKTEGTNIRFYIVGESINNAEWLKVPDSVDKATLTKRTGAVMTVEGFVKGNEYRGEFTCDGPCPYPEVRGPLTDDVTGYVGTETVKDYYCTLSENIKSYEVCWLYNVGRHLFITLTATNDIQRYVVFFLVEKLKDVKIYTPEPEVITTPMTTQAPGKNSTTAAQNSTTQTPTTPAPANTTTIAGKNSTTAAQNSTTTTTTTTTTVPEPAGKTTLEGNRILEYNF